MKIVVLVDAEILEGLQPEERSNLIERVRSFLLDESCEPIGAVERTRNGRRTWLAVYDESQVSPALTDSACAALNVDLSWCGVEVVRTDDPDAYVRTP